MGKAERTELGNEMSAVQDQYDAFPYPERDPTDEKKRLITGSPSLPVEIDHFLFEGSRDWSKTFRVLVAGGGSGDGLVQLAQLLTNAKRPYEITYLDLSKSARAVAEKRVAIRGLNNIKFFNDSLLNASNYDEFDYIDCCGVLHHLEDPLAGFKALRGAVSAEGGMGFMVYAPFGRSGVYPLQDAFNAMFGAMEPREKLAAARALFASIPNSHPFKTNPHLVDHKQSDAGFYDLLLHSQDRAFSVPELMHVLEQSDWELAGFCQPGLYNLERLLGKPHALPQTQAMGVAEQLMGTLKTHVGYMFPKGASRKIPSGASHKSVPHLSFPDLNQLAKAIRTEKAFNINCAGLSVPVNLPKSTSTLVGQINGRRNLSDIAQASNMDPITFNPLWQKIDGAFRPWGLLHYSSINVR